MRKIITLMLFVSMAMLPVSESAVVFSLSKPAPDAPVLSYSFFGLKSTADFNTNTSGVIRMCSYSNTQDNATVYQLGILAHAGTTVNCKMAIYDNSGNLLASSEQKSSVSSGENLFTISSPIQINSGTYWIALWGNANITMKNETASTVTTFNYSKAYDGSFPASVTISAINTNKRSYFANYSY